MTVSRIKKNQHLLWRAGFGPAVADLGRLATVSPAELWKDLLAASSKPPAYIDVADESVKNAYADIALTTATAIKARRLSISTIKEGSTGNDQAADQERRRIAQQSRQNIKILNLTWLEQMVSGKQQLREKLALFWHGHFAATSGNILHQQQLLDIIRTNALGNFRTLLHEVSKSASMINYLNNNQNRKNRPNENFARELMELFTIGRGQYSEQDVREAARAFTGWTADATGKFHLRSQQHDDLEKTFLGRRGNFNGDDILNILLDQKQTAYFIVRNIYSHFVNLEADTEKTNWLAERFYASGYDITNLMRDIFESDWFYEPVNIGNRVKSPIELIVGIRRSFVPDIDNQEIQLLLQRLLGQALFYPPNVAGWPGGYNWIDSSSLMLRLRLPLLISGSEQISLQPKENDDQAMGMGEAAMSKSTGRKLKTQTIRGNISWTEYYKMFRKTRSDELIEQIAETVLVASVKSKEAMIAAGSDAESREAFIQSAVIRMMCMPEYQLC